MLGETRLARGFKTLAPRNVQMQNKPANEQKASKHIYINFYTLFELLINLKKRKTEMIIFRTAKRLSQLQGKQLNLTANGIPINSTTTCKYPSLHLDPTLNFETHIICLPSDMRNLTSKVLFRQEVNEDFHL